MAYKLQTISNPDFKIALPTINKNFQELDQALITQKFTDATGTQFINGRLPDGTYGALYYRNGVPNTLLDKNGIKVARDGIDVTTATNDQIIMSSEFNLLKIAETGTVTITRNANSAIASQVVNHNLGTIPVVLGFVEDQGIPGQVTPLPLVNISAANGAVDLKVDIEDITTTKFDATVTVPANAGFFNITQTFVVRYYVFVETAN